MVPAQHWSRRGLLDENRSLWGGYVIDAGGTRFYFAGDTGYPAAFKEIGKRFPHIDFALLPIGAYEPRWFMRSQHMSPEEAARAFGELGADTLVPMHWGTFQLADEPMDEPPALLYRAMGRRANRILFLPIGGSYFAPAASSTR
jgi:L-ascorbate metabolism protein UlaG (beta-lactamase superfamily)